MSQLLDGYYDTVVPNNATIQKALAQVSDARCLVTGANGIIGYALSRLLDTYVKADIFLAVRNQHYTGREMLSTQVTHIDYASLAEQRFDYVFHCATSSPPSKFLADWQSTIRLNTDMLLDLLAATNEKLVFASSCEIYSGLSKEVTEEDGGATSPQHTRGIYIESKRVGEAACVRSGIGSASRILHTAGPYPRMDDSRVLFEIIRKGRANKEVSLVGGHHSARQYQYTGACALRMLVSGILGCEPLYNNAGTDIKTLETIAKTIAAKLDVPYRATPACAGIVGAPDSMNVSMRRFYSEFPEMENIDPSFDQLVELIIEDCP